MIKVVVNEYNNPTIQGIPCTYATKKIRSRIRELTEVVKEFTLPERYSVVIVENEYEDGNGKHVVAKIVDARHGISGKVLVEQEKVM